jgi:hypothetical protein
VISLFIKILSHEPKINHFNLAVLKSEVIRLDIFVDVLCDFMQVLNCIEHPKHCLGFGDRVIGICYGFFNAFIDKLHLDDICVIKKCLPIIFRGIRSATFVKSIRNFLECFRLPANKIARNTIIFYGGLCCNFQGDLILSFVKVYDSLTTLS